MHQAIFSDHEVGMIKEYLATGVKPEGFRVLMHRVDRYNYVLLSHVDLMLKLLLSDD